MAGLTLEQLQQMGAVPKTTPSSGVSVPATSVSTSRPPTGGGLSLEQLQKMGATPKTQQTTTQQAVADRKKAGLPVGKKEDGSPTLGGSIVREIAKMPVKLGLTLARPFVDPIGKKGGISIDSEYLGNVGDYGTEITKKTDALADRYNKGEISLGRALAGGAGAGALQAMDAASVLPVGATAKAGATAAGTALSRGALPEIAIETAKRTLGKANIPGLKQAAKEAVIRGGAVSGGYDITEQLSSGDAIKPLQTLAATALGTAFDFGATKVIPEATMLAKKQFTKEGLQQKINQSLNKAIGIKGKKSAGAFLSEAEGTKRIQALQVLNREAPNIDVVNEDGIFEKFNPSNAKFGTTVQALSKAKSNVYEKAQQILQNSGQSVKPQTDEAISFLQEIIASPSYGETSKNFARTKLLEVSRLTNIVDADKYLSNELSPLVGQALAGRDKINAKLALEISSKLRKGIDEGLSTVADAPQFRSLYSDYSALKSIEDNLVQSAQKAARRQGSGLADYVDIFAVPEVLTGVITANPTLIASGTGKTLLNQVFKLIKDPERQLRSAFRLSNKIELPQPRVESSEILEAARRGLQREPLALPPANAQQPRPVGDFIPPRQVIELPDNNVAARAREAEIEAMRANQAPSGVPPEYARYSEPYIPESELPIIRGGGAIRQATDPNIPSIQASELEPPKVNIELPRRQAPRVSEYEPYIPESELPVIKMGNTPKKKPAGDSLPSIQVDDLIPENSNINFNTKTGIITDPKKATEAAKEFVKKQGSQNGAYAVFGMEIDEDGNVSFDPAKAAGAIAVGGFAQTKAGKEAIEKINKKATELINGKPTKKAIDSLKKEIEEVELFEKARKYKSADEFVKAQGTPIYHGTTNKFDNFDISKVKNTQFGQSLYATNIKDIANKYGTDVKEFVISNKDKIVDIKEIGGVDGYLDLAKKIYRKETGNEFKPSKGTFKTGFDDIYYFKEVNSPKNISLKNKVNAELQKQGILGLKVPQVNGETTYIVFNPQSIKTKSQLEDIWNKANKK